LDSDVAELGADRCEPVDERLCLLPGHICEVVLFLVATERKPNRSNPTGRVSARKGILNALTIHYGDRIQAAG
jgi:hypothetical protein